MQKTPKILPLGEFALSLDKGVYPAVPVFRIRLKSETSLWQRIKLAIILIVNPMGLTHRLTYEEVLVLSNMVERFGLIRAVRLIKRRKRG